HHKLRYSMEESMDQPFDPTQHPDSEAPEPEFHQKFLKCMKASYPHLDAIHKRYEAELGGTGPGTPGAGNTHVPGFGAADKDDNLKMQRDQLAIEQNTLKQQNQSLQSQVNDLLLRY